MPSFLLSEALRDLRRAGRVGASAILLIALSLAALGGFWLLSLNLGRAIGQWRDRVRVVVYLREEPPAGRVDDLLARIEGVYAGPTGVGTLAAVRRLLAEEALDPDQTICCVISETGLKTEAPVTSRQGEAFTYDRLVACVRDRLRAP